MQHTHYRKILQFKYNKGQSCVQNDMTTTSLQRLLPTLVLLKQIIVQQNSSVDRTWLENKGKNSFMNLEKEKNHNKYRHRSMSLLQIQIACMFLFSEIKLNQSIIKLKLSYGDKCINMFMYLLH
jgi:hypothetical protein